MLEFTAISWPQRLHFHAVRGELTASRINRFSGALGDPGILANLLLDKTPERDAAVALVPHYVDEAWASGLTLPPGWKLVHPDNDCLDVIARIAAADMVVSSSLHGLIVADAFEIPAVWALTKSDLHARSQYKFFDYSSARRSAFNAPSTYEDLMALPRNALESLGTVPGRSVREWQAELIAAFPL